MTFKKQWLYSRCFSLVDIGSFKVRAISGKLQGNSIHILGFGEKRQDQESFFLWEMYDVETITENIGHVLWKTKKEKTDAYIANIVNQFFLFSHPMNHVRKNEKTPITEEELYTIIKDIERNCIALAIDEISQKTGYSKADIKLTMSSISLMTLDGEKIVNPVGKTGKNIKIYLVNIFVPLSEFDIATKMFRALDIEKIEFMPFEYAVFKLFDELEDICVINVGNSKTYISIQNDEHIVWTSRIPIGMNDLIKKIKEKYGFTQIEVLKNLDKYFEEERAEFLEIFEDCVATGIKEIIKQWICPGKIFLIGGGGNNQFLKDYFTWLDLTKKGVKQVKKMELVPMPTLDIENAQFLETPSNIELWAMLLAYQDFDKKRNNFLSKALAQAVEEIESE